MKKAAGLVKQLALAPDHRLHREQVTEALWPGQGRRMASNSFRQALYIARRTLDPDAAVASRLLDYREEHVTLCPHHPLRVDVEAFQEATSTARKEKVPAAYRAASTVIWTRLRETTFSRAEAATTSLSPTTCPR